MRKSDVEGSTACPTDILIASITPLVGAAGELNLAERVLRLGASGRQLVAVGLTGSDLSRDGGATWSAADSVPYNSLQFAGAIGFAVGPKGRIARIAVPR